MQTQTINLMNYLVRGTLFLAMLVLFASLAAPAHAHHPRDNSEYQVSALLGKTTEALVMMQESVETEYDYTKKKEDTEYYDYSKKKEYVEPEYKKTTVSSDANLAALLEQIKQLQALIMILLEMQKSISVPSEKESWKPAVTPSKETADLMKHAKEKNVSDDELDELKDEWSFVDSSVEILVAGAYQGTLPHGQKRSFNDDGEGEITVHVPFGSGESLLVLSAYEPTHWNLEGEGLKHIQSILLTGYHEQRVSGVPDDINVIERVWEDGDSPYFVIYNGKGKEDDDYPALQQYIKNATGYAPYLFFGEYEAKDIYISLKG